MQWIAKFKVTMVPLMHKAALLSSQWETARKIKIKQKTSHFTPLLTYCLACRLQCFVIKQSCFVNLIKAFWLISSYLISKQCIRAEMYWRCCLYVVFVVFLIRWFCFVGFHIRMLQACKVYIHPHIQRSKYSLFSLDSFQHIILCSAKAVI